MYSASERQIFKFHDGTKQRAVDPLAVFRKLHSAPGLNLVADVQAVELLQSHFARVEKDPKAAESEVGQQVQAKGLEAWDRLLTATRSALGVPEFHLDDNGREVGMTDAETMGAFLSLMDYLKGLKKSINLSPTVPPTTAPSA